MGDMEPNRPMANIFSSMPSGELFGYDLGTLHDQGRFGDGELVLYEMRRRAPLMMKAMRNGSLVLPVGEPWVGLTEELERQEVGITYWFSLAKTEIKHYENANKLSLANKMRIVKNRRFRCSLVVKVDQDQHRYLTSWDLNLQRPEYVATKSGVVIVSLDFQDETQNQISQEDQRTTEVISSSSGDEDSNDKDYEVHHSATPTQRQEKLPTTFETKQETEQVQKPSDSKTEMASAGV